VVRHHGDRQLAGVALLAAGTFLVVRD
jgi:hypothetical protein